MRFIALCCAWAGLATSACRAPNPRTSTVDDENARNCAFNVGDHANLRYAFGPATDAMLSSAGETRIMLLLADSARVRPASGALVRLAGRDTVMKATNDGGAVTMVLRAPGPYQLLIRHILFRRTIDTVTLRSGFQDTIYVDLHASRQCLSRTVNW